MKAGGIHLCSALLFTTAGCSVIVSNGDDGGNSRPDVCGTTSVLAVDLTGPDAASRWVFYTDDPLSDGAASGSDAIDFEYSVQEETSNNPHAELRSRNAYSLIQDGVSAKVTWDQPDETVTPFLELRVTPGEIFDSSAGMEVSREGDEHVLAAYADTQLRQVRYDPVAHAYWAIRHDGETLEFLTSETGELDDFVSFFSLAGSGPLDPERVVVALGVARYDEQNPINGFGTVRFSEINAGAFAIPTCPAEDLETDFSTTTLDAKWRGIPFSGCDPEPGVDGVRLAPGAFIGCRMRTATPYDFTGADVWIELGEISTVADSRTQLTLEYVELDRYARLTAELFDSEMTYLLELFSNDNPTTSLDLNVSDPDAVRFWRIREQDGNLLYSLYDSSANMLTAEQSIPASDVLDPSHLVLEVATEGGDSGGSSRVVSIGPAPPEFSP